MVRSTDFGNRATTGSIVCGYVIVSSQRMPAHQSSPSSSVVLKLYLLPELGIIVSDSLACQSLFFFLRFKFNEPMSVNPLCMLQNAKECVVFLF